VSGQLCPAEPALRCGGGAALNLANPIQNFEPARPQKQARRGNAVPRRRVLVALMLRCISNW
jgi:hypothetical protein